MDEGARNDVAELDRSELERALEDLGHERFRGRQIFRWVYRRGVADFARMTDVPLDLRAELT